MALSTVVWAAAVAIAPWPTFEDVTGASRVAFRHQASPTSEKYLLETMGSGVAIFDANGDALLDLYFVNGAKLDASIQPGAVPRKFSPDYWNRLFVQRPGNQFVDVTEKAGVGGEGYGMGAAVADYDNCAGKRHAEGYAAGVTGIFFVSSRLRGFAHATAEP